MESTRKATPPAVTLLVCGVKEEQKKLEEKVIL